MTLRCMCAYWWECGDDCGEVTMVGGVVGGWLAEVDGIGRCAAVVCSDG